MSNAAHAICKYAASRKVRDWIINSFTEQAIANPLSNVRTLERCSHGMRKANVLDEEQSQQFCRAALIAESVRRCPIGQYDELRDNSLHSLRQVVPNPVHLANDWIQYRNRWLQAT